MHFSPLASPELRHGSSHNLKIAISDSTYISLTRPCRNYQSSKMCSFRSIKPHRILISSLRSTPYPVMQCSRSILTSYLRYRSVASQVPNSSPLSDTIRALQSSCPIHAFPLSNSSPGLILDNSLVSCYFVTNRIALVFQWAQQVIHSISTTKD